MFTGKRFGRVTLGELIGRIPWWCPLAVAFIISFLDLLYMGVSRSVYASGVAMLAIPASYYYFFLYYRLFFARKLLPVNFYEFWGSVVLKKSVSFHYARIVVLEELLFRYIPILILSVLGWCNVVSLVVITLAFTVLHIKPDRNNSMVMLAELFIFFFLQALLYSYIMFFPLLLIPHFTRNMCIAEVSRQLKINRGKGSSPIKN